MNVPFPPKLVRTTVSRRGPGENGERSGGETTPSVATYVPESLFAPDADQIPISRGGPNEQGWAVITTGDGEAAIAVRCEKPSRHGINPSAASLERALHA